MTAGGICGDSLIHLIRSGVRGRKIKSSESGDFWGQVEHLEVIRSTLWGCFLTYEMEITVATCHWVNVKIKWNNIYESILQSIMYEMNIIFYYYLQLGSFVPLHQDILNQSGF